MIVERIMSARVVTVEMDDSLKVVKKIFDSVHFHHLLVVSRRKLVGVISDRDLLEVISPYIGTVRETARDIASLDMKVHQVMTRQLHVLDKNATINDAVKLFNSHAITCIPIVDEKFKPVGIVSWKDLLREFQLSDEEEAVTQSIVSEIIIEITEEVTEEVAEAFANENLSESQKKFKEQFKSNLKMNLKEKITKKVEEHMNECMKDAVKESITDCVRAGMKETMTNNFKALVKSKVMNSIIELMKNNDVIEKDQTSDSNMRYYK